MVFIFICKWVRLTTKQEPIEDDWERVQKALMHAQLPMYAQYEDKEKNKMAIFILFDF